MWDLLRPRLEPVSPPLAGGFLTTVPPGKPDPLDSEVNVWGCRSQAGGGRGTGHAVPPKSYALGFWKSFPFLSWFCWGAFHNLSIQGNSPAKYIVRKKGKPRQHTLISLCCLNRNKLLKNKIYSLTDIFSVSNTSLLFAQIAHLCKQTRACVNKSCYLGGKKNLRSILCDRLLKKKKKKERLTFLRRYFERLCLFIVRNILKKWCFLLCIFKSL